MKRISKALLGVSAFTVLGFSTAFANPAPLKIGVVDLATILQTAPQVAAVSNKLKSEFAPQQKQIVDLQTKIRGEVTQLTSDTANKLTPEAKKKLQDSVSADQKQLQADVIKMQESLAKAQNTAMQNLMGEIDKAASDIAVKQSLDMVMLKQAVLYPKATDITKDVMANLPK